MPLALRCCHASPRRTVIKTAEAGNQGDEVMVSSALLAAVLTAATSQAKPEAVVLTSSPFITKPALTSSRTLAIYEANQAVRAHLLERIEETWSIDAIEAESTPPI